MSQQFSFEFKTFIPSLLYTRYFETCVADAPVYICVVNNDSQIGQVYLEKPPEANYVGAQPLEGQIRVFFTAEDHRRYAKSVSLAEGIPFEFIRRWEMKFSVFVDYISQMDAAYKELGKPGVRAVASAIHDEKFVDLDILWTAERDCMV